MTKLGVLATVCALIGCSAAGSATALADTGSTATSTASTSLAGTTTTSTSATGTSTTYTCPWVDSALPIAQRVQLLLAQMTTAQMESLVVGAGGSGYHAAIAGVPSLCVPELTMSNGPEGISGGAPGTTQLPAAVAAAASWSVSLMRAWGTLIGAEAAGRGINVIEGPTINIVRDPRWGRAFESLGEDPFLSGQLGAAEIEGIQSQGVMAMVKHLAAYNQETNRNTSQDDVIVSPRVLQEIYLPAFRAAVQQANVASVMCSYAYVNGIDACENQYLYSVLSGEFGFTGFVASDWFGTHSTLAAARVGLDVEMPLPNYFGSPLDTDLSSGQLRVSILRTMCSRILTEMFRFGLIGASQARNPTAVVTNASHVAFARQVAERGAVLLRNKGSLLPLSGANGRSVAVIGLDASGNVLANGRGSAAVSSANVVSPLAGITARAGSGANVTYVAGEPAAGDQPLVPASAFPQGLSASYYANTTLSGTPVTTDSATQVSFSWPDGSPDTGVPSSGWSASFTGQIEAPASGTYRFTLDSGSGSVENGAVLKVGGQTVISDPSGTGPSPSTGELTLTAGVPVTIEIDYFQTASAAASEDAVGAYSLQLGWVNLDSLRAAAAATAANANVAVLVVGTPEREGSDLSSISLTSAQNALVSAVAKANPNTIVVLNTGSAVTMPWAGQVAAIIEAWYPGQEYGDALAALLYGDVNFSGRLPVSFPRSLAQSATSTTAQFPGVNGQVHYSEGLLVGYRYFTTKHVAPLYPFGFGLSYTTFKLSRLEVRSTVSHGKHAVAATVQVKNDGVRSGTETVQLYVHDPAALGEPAEQLKGFATVTLAPHRSAIVRIPLSFSSFSYYSSSKSKWLVAPGSYKLLAGDSSAHLPLSATLQIKRGWRWQISG